MRVRLQVMWVLCGLAAVVPLLGSQSAVHTLNGAPEWPAHFEGKPLRALPLNALEQSFAAGFPGRMARFTDGRREIILRWVSEDTRKLHPASDCFRGAGYTVTPQPAIVDAQGARWGSFTATRGGQRLEVRERIYDTSNQQWTDVSAWYWAAATGQSRGPWWAVTLATAAPEN